MTDTPATKPTRDDAALVLGVLSAVEQDSAVTQRGLSSDLGIALGLANAVLKRCVRKGLIKIANAPLNRYAYYLTPQGMAEKGRLTVEYLRVSFDLFRDALNSLGVVPEKRRRKIIIRMDYWCNDFENPSPGLGRRNFRKLCKLRAGRRRERSRTRHPRKRFH